MFKQGIIVFLLASLITPVCFTAEPETTIPFPIYPETTQSGEFLCDMWFWRGEPPCFKTTAAHGAYIRYPTRQKARIIVDMYIEEGIYAREVLATFFGSLMVGTYQPDGVAPVGDFWDSGYFGLVKLDFQLDAKNILWDVVFQQNWAKGKFLDQRYKALKVLSSERLITLREYGKLREYLVEELQSDSVRMEWANALVTALSSFREWNEELLPLFRQLFEKTQPGAYRPVLQAFIDFNIPDDGVFILNKVLEEKIVDLDDIKLCTRAAYVLDDEYAYRKLKELYEEMKSDDPANAEFKTYLEETIARLDWFGRWEILDTKETWDDGLKGEFISFRMVRSLDETKDMVDFSMPMQITDPEELLPIGTDVTYLTNNVSFTAGKDTLVLKKYNPYIKNTFVKAFEIQEGKGRDAGKLYLRFPLEGEVDKKGNPKYGWVEVEKVS